jgi:TatD DNase family protein
MLPFDSHVHFDAFENPEKTIKDSKKVISGAIHPGINSETNKVALEFAKKYKNFVYAALAIHPTNLPKYTKEQISNEIDFIEKNKNKIVAIGEAGLDNKAIKVFIKKNKDQEKKKQERVFKELLQLSNSLEKPIIVHSRWATKKVLDMLKQEKAKNVILHSFSGNLEEIKIGLKAKYSFSITPNHALLSQKIPVDKILLESDSPYMKYRGVINTPASVKYVIENISKNQNISEAKIISQTNKNIEKIFKIKI